LTCITDTLHRRRREDEARCGPDAQDQLGFRNPPRPTLFPYTTLFRSLRQKLRQAALLEYGRVEFDGEKILPAECARRIAAERERSEEHTSELQSRFDLVCRLLLEKKTRCPRSTGIRQTGQTYRLRLEG